LLFLELFLFLFLPMIPMRRYSISMRRRRCSCYTVAREFDCSCEVLVREDKRTRRCPCRSSMVASISAFRGRKLGIHMGDCDSGEERVNGDGAENGVIGYLRLPHARQECACVCCVFAKNSKNHAPKMALLKPPRL
jgi:hypothetical protein